MTKPSGKKTQAKKSKKGNQATLSAKQLQDVAGAGNLMSSRGGAPVTGKLDQGYYYHGPQPNLQYAPPGARGTGTLQPTNGYASQPVPQAQGKFVVDKRAGQVVWKPR